MAYQKTDKSTMHGSKTPHGLKVPHRYPVASGQGNTDIFSGLVKQLYPTGRAWYIKRNGFFDRLHQAINRSFIRVVEDCKFTIDSQFPDNVNFNENDATLWEYRLGLITNTQLSLEVRKQAILRKMSYPNNIKARQNKLFIEAELQKAGFEVWVHENVPPYQTPADISGLSSTNTQHANDVQHGDGLQHGSTGFQVIANLSSPTEDFAIGGDLWPTFFIGGEDLGNIANVPLIRQREFKELVLKLKPAHLVAFTFVNYV